MAASHAFYNYLLNPVVRCLLRSPFHGVASGNIALLHYTGRKSGRAFHTPLSYVRDGDTVLLLSSLNTGWWKNFRGDARAVEIDVAGEHCSGTAVLHEGDSDTLRDRVRTFLTALPRDAVIYGVKMDRQKQPVEASLEKQVSRLVVVEISLS